MTYEEYKKKDRELERKLNEVFILKNELLHKYIKEHEPLHLKRYQRISVRLRITEQHRKLMTDKQLNIQKYQLGNEYVVKVFFTGYCIGKKGDIRPCFYGDTCYSIYDDIVSVELDKVQPQGDCHKCSMYKDRRCYMAGGKDLGTEYATHKVKDGDCVCPKYEEIIPGGLYKYGMESNHCRNVTVKYDLKGRRFYRVYSINWQCYTEYDETDVWKYYTKEPKEI